MRKKIILSLTVCLTISLACCGCTKSKNQSDDCNISTLTDTLFGYNDSDNTTTENDDTEDATTVASDKEDEDTTEGTTSGQSTTESHRDDDSDTPSNPRTTETTTEAPSAPSDPGHSHKWEPVYSTRMVQQYADDGTTNDYSKPITEEKPIYEERPIYEETPIWETHIFNNGVDCTVAMRNYNAQHGTSYRYGDKATVYEVAEYLHNLGATSNRTYSDQVQVGTEKVQVGTEKVQVGTETVITGYKQLGKVEEKYISGYRCSCGATK